MQRDRLAEPTEQKGFVSQIVGYIGVGALIIIALGTDDQAIGVMVGLGVLVWAGLHPSETLSFLESAAPVILLVLGMMIAAMILLFVVGFATVKLGGRFIDDE